MKDNVYNDKDNHKLTVCQFGCKQMESGLRSLKQLILLRKTVVVDGSFNRFIQGEIAYVICLRNMH